jgi:hypothetical protein
MPWQRQAHQGRRRDLPPDRLVKRYLARCERNLNNTSWKKISDGCPVSEASPAQMSPWPAAKVALRKG